MDSALMMEAESEFPLLMVLTVKKFLSFGAVDPCAWIEMYILF